jgi:predicted porin
MSTVQGSAGIGWRQEQVQRHRGRRCRLQGNRLGFKGEEALGNGLKAVFTLEYGLVSRQQLRPRQRQYRRSERPPAVRRAGRATFGTVALGRQYAPGFNATANNDALEATDMGIQSSLSALMLATRSPRTARRDSTIPSPTPATTCPALRSARFTASAKPRTLPVASTTTSYRPAIMAS